MQQHSERESDPLRLMAVTIIESIAARLQKIQLLIQKSYKPRLPVRWISHNLLLLQTEYRLNSRTSEDKLLPPNPRPASKPALRERLDG